MGFLLQEVGVHVIASAEVLRENPLPHAVASYPLKEAAAAIRGGGVSLPEGAGRFVVSVDGTESEEEITALKVGLNCQADHIGKVEHLHTKTPDCVQCKCLSHSAPLHRGLKQ